MTLWTEPPRIRQLRTLDEFPSPGLDALGAAATQALYDSPSWQIRRRLEDARARDPYVWEYDESGARIIGDKPIVDKATAIAKAKEQGVDLTIPDTGVTEDYLALQIKRKKEYQQRQDIMARSPKGLLFGTAEFTTGLAASMLDPLNIAASFIPVGRLVAPAMAARAETAATLGQRTMARAVVGAIEGTAGQALVEPLTAFSYSQEQLDYTLINSLQNIAFGAILGSAAHTGFGLIRDKLGPRPQTQFQKLMDNLDPTVKINALKAEVANIVEGRNGDISPVLRPFVKEPQPTEFSGEIVGVHGSEREFVSVVSAKDIPEEVRYDGTGGVWGDGLYSAEQGNYKWFRGGEIRMADYNYATEVSNRFQKAAVITPDNTVELFQKLGISKVNTPEMLAEKIRESGYDGVIVRGFDNTQNAAEVLIAKLENAGIVSDRFRSQGGGSAFMDQVVHFAPESGVKIVGADTKIGPLVEERNKLRKLLNDKADEAGLYDYNNAQILRDKVDRYAPGGRDYDADNPELSNQNREYMIKQSAGEYEKAIAFLAKFADEERRIAELNERISAIANESTAIGEPKPSAVDMDAVARAAEQRYAPENNKYADIQALNELDAMPVKDDAVLLKEQADDMMAEAKMHAEQLGFDLPELKQLADIDAKATQYAKAVKAAAVCGIRG